MKFIEWLKLREVETSTGSIAVFARPIGSGGVIERQPINMIGGVIQDDEKKKKKNKKLI